MRKPINILLVLAAVVALVATGVGLAHRLVTGKANKRAQAAMLEKNAALKAQIADLKTAAPASRRTGTTETAADVAAKKAAYDKFPGRAKGPWGVSEKPEYQQERRNALEEHKINDREFGLKYYAALRSDVNTQYGPFYRLQQLTKEQTDTLAEALFQRQLRYDQADAGKQMGGSAADAQAAKAGADAELAAAAQEALGADLYDQFSLYERQRPAWDYIGKMGGLLSLADMPLSFEQASRLADAMANANTSFQDGAAITGETEDWNAVDIAAADFLTPEQLDFLKNTYISEDSNAFRHLSGLSRQTMEVNDAFKKSGFGAKMYHADEKN